MSENLLTNPIKTSDDEMPRRYEDGAKIADGPSNDVVKLRFYYADNLDRWSMRLMYVRPHEIENGKKKEEVNLYLK